MYYAVKLEWPHDWIEEMYERFQCVVYDKSEYPSLLNEEVKDGIEKEINATIGKVEQVVGYDWRNKEVAEVAQALNQYEEKEGEWSFDDIYDLKSGVWWRQAYLTSYGAYKETQIGSELWHFATLYYNPDKMTKEDIYEFEQEYYRQIYEWVVFEGDDMALSRGEASRLMDVMSLKSYHVYGLRSDEDQLKDLALRIGTTVDNIKGFSLKKITT